MSASVPSTVSGPQGPTGSRAVPAERSQTQPVVYWAALGAAILVFAAFILGKWVTGPNFESVPAGPSEVPTWMKAILISWQVIFPALSIYLFWRLLIRPWRRERRLTTDGLLLVAWLAVFFWDPAGNYLGVFYTYNTYLLNMGSWLNEFPGSRAVGEPGAMMAEPLLLGPSIYITMCYGGSVIACWVMRRSSARWPKLGPMRIFGICVVTCIILDIIAEAFIWMPIGYYTFAGSWGPSMFPDAFHKFPLSEAFLGGFWWALMSAVRYYKNDRGETIAERGVSNMSGGPLKKGGIRVLALVAAMSVVQLTWMVPVAMFIGSQQAEWPKDIVTRSYFTNGLCGAGTDRMCPGGAVPSSSGNDAAYLNRQGQLVVPQGARLPTSFPFERRPSRTMFEGTLLGKSTRYPLADKP